MRAEPLPVAIPKGTWGVGAASLAGGFNPNLSALTIGVRKVVPLMPELLHAINGEAFGCNRT